MNQHPFSWPVRVYYEDTDTGGIVFYANYLKFFERARTEWLRSGGVEQSNLAKQHGVMFVVARTALDYHAPARLDDALRLWVTVEKSGRASVEFLQQAWREQPSAPPLLLATGRIKVACVRVRDFKPCPIPEQVLQLLQSARMPG